MTELEKQITDVINVFQGDMTATAKTFVNVKKALNTTAKTVKAAEDFSNSLNTNIKSCSDSTIGKIGGWMAGKTTKAVIGLSSSLVAGTIKTATAIIPDAGSPKKPEIDAAISSVVEKFELPADKDELLELVKYLWENVYGKTSEFGDRTKKVMKILHDEAYTSLTSLAENDKRLLKIAKSYSPQKKFGFFG